MESSQLVIKFQLILIRFLICYYYWEYGGCIIIIIKFLKFINRFLILNSVVLFTYYLFAFLTLVMSSVSPLYFILFHSLLFN